MKDKNGSVHNRTVFAQLVYSIKSHFCQSFFAPKEKKGIETAIPHTIRPHQIRVRGPQPMLVAAVAKREEEAAAAM